ncbi:SIR2 family protein [Sphingobacterium faecium]|uniref:SIR2 family protein n=1 Tax=Sphingobacterium faecium TaxID=34087 RepID=UPI00247A9455|nr:SIR2 family protein [Sphingobacterium faecium]WGQ15448.1 SIR2 family protein [Sphingobacterium faecium]
MKRTVFLLGAGAAIDWNGPTTNQLTDSLIKQGPSNSKDELIINYIYEYFNNGNTKDDKLNFEGLIDIIEQCAQYWISKDLNSTINAKLISEDDKFWEHSFSEQYITGYRNYNPKLSPKANFFCKLLLDCYEVIIYHIRQYSCFTQNINKIYCEKNSEINHLAAQYFQEKSKNSYVRIYSLNYDRVIQAIFKKTNIPFFQGFASENIVPSVDERHQQVDSKRILTSLNENCIYHLHGNFCWTVDNTNLNGLDGYQIVNSYYHYPLENNGFQQTSSEKNKPLFLTPIITGYSKVQRTNLTPFKQMASAFDIDCHTADELIIIGYSFGDLHINDTIRQARKNNPNIKITIITSPRNKNETLRKISSDLTSNWAIYEDFVFESNKDEAYSKQFNLRVIFKYFKEYLKSHYF